MTAMAEENPLIVFFEKHNGNRLYKFMHYFDIYHRHFNRFRNQPVTILEFGVLHGGSLQMWKDYFGPQARIIGVDIEPACEKLAEEQISIHIGDQDDRQFLRDLITGIGPVDIVIDDGGHEMTQQLNTFEEIYPSVRVDGGVYLVEDLHTSYWDDYGGGYRRSGTFIEHAKGLIDQLTAWHSHEPDTFRVDDFTRTTRSMHIYDSVVVFEKAAVPPPVVRHTGHQTVPE